MRFPGAVEVEGGACRRQESGLRLGRVFVGRQELEPVPQAQGREPQAVAVACAQGARKALCRGSSGRGSRWAWEQELGWDAQQPEEAGRVRRVRYPGRWGRVPAVAVEELGEVREEVAEARFGRVQPVRCLGNWDTEPPAEGAVLAGAREVEVAHFGQVPQAEGGSSQEKAASHRQDSCWSRRRRGCWRLDKGRRDRSDDFRKSWAVFLGWKSDRVAQ